MPALPPSPVPLMNALRHGLRPSAAKRFVALVALVALAVLAVPVAWALQRMLAPDSLLAWLALFTMCF
jgi:hypothetical protein